MDTAEITHVSLCAGYGGIDLGLKRAVPKLRTVAFSEIEAFACANLVAKMEAGLLDAAPVWTDLKTFPWASFHGKVDILSGGYPCQPFSAAGKRLGADDPRHLWPFISNGIVSMQPRLCFFENVEGHISLGLEHVLRDLQRIGYRCTFGIFSAAEVGAPHQRKRVFTLACHNPNWTNKSMADANCIGDARSGDKMGSSGKGRQGGAHPSSHSVYVNSLWPTRPGEPQHEWEPPRVVGNTEGFNVQRQTRGLGQTSFGGTSSEQFGRQTEPALGGDADGIAYRLDDAELYKSCDNRTDELRLLGNGVVPATAERAFRVLLNRFLSS